MTTPQLILASSSKTRRLLLENAGLSFDVQKPLVDEDELKAALIDEGLTPRDCADQLAEAKGRSVSMMLPDAIVLASDQTLDFKGTLLSKAEDMAAVKTCLIALSGESHKLHTAAVFFQGGGPIWRFVDTATLTMRALTEHDIDQYLNGVGEAALWSVGGYQLEGLGIQLFDDLKGDYFTVLGLPLVPVLRQLRILGFDRLQG